MMINFSNILRKMDTGEITRAEIFALVLRLGFLGCISVYTFKHLINILDPTNKEKKEAHKRAQTILSKLSLSQSSLDEHELIIASNLIDPQEIHVTWKDIGGLGEVIEELKFITLSMRKSSSRIQPSLDMRPPSGVLLHGPPGCGKTMLAKAIARESGARFINLDTAMLFNKWYGESQKLAKAVFTLAEKIQPCIIFIDEIDSFLRSRNLNDHEATAMLKAQFLMLWDGLATEDRNKVIIIGATNRPKEVDNAILRRMPEQIPILAPDVEGRKKILCVIIDPKSIDGTVDIEKLAQLTENFSGSNLKELNRMVAMHRSKKYCKNHPELFESFDIESCSSSTTSDNYSLINDSDINGLPLINMDDYMVVLQKISDRKLVLDHSISSM